MRFSTYINNQKALEWGLNANQAALFGGSFWQYEYNTDQPYVDVKGRVRVNCHAVASTWQQEAIAWSSGLVMRWFRDAFLSLDKEKAKELEVGPCFLLCFSSFLPSPGVPICLTLHRNR